MRSPFNIVQALMDHYDTKAAETASFIMALRAQGIRDINVLRAMETVPRDFFAPQRFRDLSRTNVSLPLACGQTMTSPAMVASMLVALGAQAGQRVLEIGTGSGYISALLVRMGCVVHTIERYATLGASAFERFRIAGLSDDITLTIGDGLAPSGPQDRYDRILMNGAVMALPAPLTSLLVPEGRLIGAMSFEDFPRLIRVERGANGILKQELKGPLRLPLLAQGESQFL
jgi:protein-L-isoaspartate(D-aspartate) O-methyltransferase